MKRLLGSTAAKIAVFLCLCVLIPLTAAGAFGTIYCYESGIYAEKADFQNSQICQSFVRKRLYDIKQFIYWNDVSAIPESEFYYNNTSFSYKITDENGKVIIDTTKNRSVLSVDNYIAYEVDSYGNSTKEYVLQGYVNLPVEPTDSLYFYKVAYDLQEKLLDITITLAAISVILLIWLLAAAGYGKDGTVTLRGLNRCWLDVFAVICVGVFLSIANGIAEEINYYYDSDVYSFTMIGIGMICATAAALFLLMSAAAHFKIKGWWKHTAVYALTMALWRFIKWLVCSLPRVWKLLIVYGVFVLVNLIGMAVFFLGGGFFAFLMTVTVDFGGIVLLILFSDQLGKLRRAGEALAAGNYEYKTDSSNMWFGLKAQANDLNSAAVGMSKAVDARMKSERFKTELITNVSHDLKTPLTSIVSYVDLLKKENIENEKAKEYIEVIDRQSKKLKKLTEDLVEASKASSGAVTVNRENLNIGELINQSVGEFSEKLDSAGIIPVINLPENDVYVFTDGRLLWRVFDNLIQNIIKYAQPGTRAYFDLTPYNGKAVLCIKNISREPLNMSSEALMERFVRGDSSRGSDGNGLGLSISKSLTELCGGTFELFLDGDLYKAVLTFPLSKAAPEADIKPEAESQAEENVPERV